MTGAPVTKGAYSELLKAQERVGLTSVQMMRWLLRFIQCPIKSLSAGDLLNCQYEVAYFSLYGVPPLGLDCVESALTPRIVASDKTRSFIFLRTREHLEKTQSSLHPALDAIVKKHTLSTKIPEVTLLLCRHEMDHEEGDKAEHWVLVTNSAEPNVPFTYALFLLLKTFAPRLLRCPECGTIFLADRSNQEFCDSRCQTRVATRRYRAVHGLITGRPRGRPRKKSPQAELSKGKTPGVPKRARRVPSLVR